MRKLLFSIILSLPLAAQVPVGGGGASTPGSGSIASTTSVIKGNGAGAGIAATAGSDFSKPNTTETTSGDRTFTGAVDASGATSTAPIKSGTATPGTCSVPQMYFETDATAGANIWLCTSTNTWTQVSGGGGSSLPTDLNITRTSSTLLTMASGTFLYNNTPFSFAGGTVTMASFVGSTTLKFCLASDGTIKAAHDASEGLFTIAGFDEVGGVSECPSATEVVWQWVVTSGVFDATGSDYRYKRRVRDEASATSTVTSICRGGDTTVRTQTTEPSSGVAPAFSCTIPANFFSTVGKAISCKIFVQQASTDGTHAGVMNLKTYINGSVIGGGSGMQDGAGTDTTSSFEIELRRTAVTDSIHMTGQEIRNSGSFGTGATGSQTATLTSAITLEFRPWMTSIGDDSFQVQSYYCIGY